MVAFTFDPAGSTPLLARALLGLERRRATGTLLVASTRTRALIAISDGYIDDLQIRSESGLPREPSKRRSELQRRLVRVMKTRRVDLRFRAAEPQRPPEHTSTSIVLSAVRCVVRGMPIERMVRSPGQRLEVTRLGRSLRRGAPLWPHEHAILGALECRRVLELRTILGLAGGSVRTIRSLEGLRLVGAVAPYIGPARGRLTTLAQKHLQLRAARPPWEVLGVSPAATKEERRRAARDLAAALHPDRFAGLPRELQDASEKVTRAVLGGGSIIG